MRTRAMRRVAARYTWDRLRVSFWFAPAVMALIAIPLARLMYWIGGHIPPELIQNSSFILSGSASELRGLLLNMATTVLTTTGVVFTLLTLPLSTVAAQYGSRLLRVFLSDRTTQFVLGIFTGTFVYCITAAAAIPEVELQPEASQFAATVGLILMLASFGCLILLIQHIGTMLQAPNIAAIAGAELINLVSVEIQDLDERSNVQPQTGRMMDTLVESEGYLIRVQKTGYVQYIDPDYILTLARARNLFIRLLYKPGDFVWQGKPFALVWPAGQVNQKVEKQFLRALQIGNQRTPTQDVEFAANQLVEMAVRAMSPAINDPFTAMTCLDYLGRGLALFARYGGEYRDIYDQDGELRLVFDSLNFSELIQTVFEMLRHTSNNNSLVLAHMLNVIETISQETETPDTYRELSRQVSLIQSECMAGALVEEDKQAINLRCETMLQKLQNIQP